MAPPPPPRRGPRTPPPKPAPAPRAPPAKKTEKPEKPAPPKKRPLEIDRDVVWFVDSDRDETVLLALDLHVTEHGIEWFDTVHDRVFVPRAPITKERDTLFFETEGARYALSPLTLDRYVRSVRKRIHTTTPPLFESTEEVQAYFRRLLE